MSTKKLAISDRVRNFRKRVELSQAELGERLGVSGNYIYLIESGQKPPGPSLVKLFESFEQSPLYSNAALASPDGSAVRDSAKAVPPNAFFGMLSTELLLENFSEVSGKLVAAKTDDERKPIIGQLRDMLGAIEQRMLASSGPLSEAQRIAVRAASRRGGPCPRRTKRRRG